MGHGQPEVPADCRQPPKSGPGGHLKPGAGLAFCGSPAYLTGSRSLEVTILVYGWASEMKAESRAVLDQPAFIPRDLMCLSSQPWISTHGVKQ